MLLYVLPEVLAAEGSTGALSTTTGAAIYAEFATEAARPKYTKSQT